MLLCGAARVTVSYERELASICLKVERGQEVDVINRVGIQFLRLKFGDRAEFVCPCCGQRRRRLILQRDQLICGAMFRADGHGLDHSQRRQALKSARWHHPTEESFRSPVKDVGPLNGCQPGRSNKLGTYAAIQLGRGAFQHDVYSEFLSSDRERLEAEANLMFQPRPPLSTGLLNHFPRLDILELARLGWLRGTGLRAIKLGWEKFVCEGYELTLFVDLRPQHDPAVFIARRISDNPFQWQHLPLHRRGGVSARWTFSCPVRATPTDHLYFRSGRFASRVAQRLRYPRQQEYL